MNADDMPIVNQEKLNQEDCNKQEKKGDSYSQNGSHGIGHKSGGVIKGNAKVIGTEENNKSQCQEINAKQVTVNNNNPSNNLDNTTIKITKTTTVKIGDRETSNTISIEIPPSHITVDLKELLEDIAGSSIKIKDIEKGSIRFILKGSEQGLNRIAESFKSGKLAPRLRERFNLELENAQLIDSDRYQKDRSQKLLAFTIAGDVSQADIDILKAALIDTSDNDEKIKNEEKSRLVEEIKTQGAVKRNLSDADLRSADLRSADLRSVNLSSANLSGANLYGANLYGANLIGANLYDANLYGAYLYDANLCGAYLYGANLCGAEINDKTKLDKKWHKVWEIVNQPEANRNLSGADLSGADLSEANLSGADLSEANLSEANLSDANLSGANLSGANLSDANLSEANLSDANLSGANLSEANLIGANLSEANLYGANLYGADLSGTYLIGANLYGAYLSDAYFSDANLSNANLSGANVENTYFINNLKISEPLKQSLIKRGAIFKDSPGDRSEDLTPV
jgi:uncharacterized protein YjbI with pentapeptide repeats